MTERNALRIRRGLHTALVLYASGCANEFMPDTSVEAQTVALQADTELAVEKVETARGVFTFRKFLTAGGDIYITVENADGRKVSPEETDGPPPGPISDRLAKVLQDVKADEIIAVAIGLREPTNDSPLSETGSVHGASNSSMSDGSATINGRVVDQKGLMEAVQARGAALADWQKQKTAARRTLIENVGLSINWP